MHITRTDFTSGKTAKTVFPMEMDVCVCVILIAAPFSFACRVAGIQITLLHTFFITLPEEV